MQESLSIIVPVRDRQSSIQARTESLLELVSDLSRNIQLILVDDHSTDATPEVLDDLRRKYPQILVTHNRQTLGPSRAAESGLHRASGDFIFIHPSYDPVNFDELVQLWRLRRDEQLVIARASTQVRRIDTGFVNRLREWSQQLRKPASTIPTQWNGLHMMRRSGIDQLANVEDAPSAVEVSHQSHRRLAAPNLARTAQTRARS